MKRARFTAAAALACMSAGAVTLASPAAVSNAAVPSAAPTALTVKPPLQSVTKGGAVTFQVADQSGDTISGSNITYTVTGRNNGKSGAAASDGFVTYSDSGVNPASSGDTIVIVDNTDSLNATATVSYVTGPSTASTVTVDTSGSGTSDANCAAAGHTGATNVASGHHTTVCAVVKNSNGELLAGKAITFAVVSGQVAAVGGLVPSSGASYQTTTDAAGAAFADVTSTVGGAQGVNVSAGSATASGTVSYASAGSTPTPTATPTGTPTPTPTPTPTQTSTPTHPAALSLSTQTGIKVGGHETITATATNSDGSSAARQIVRFFVSHSNSASGSAITDAGSRTVHICRRTKRYRHDRRVRRYQ